MNPDNLETRTNLSAEQKESSKMFFLTVPTKNDKIPLFLTPDSKPTATSATKLFPQTDFVTQKSHFQSNHAMTSSPYKEIVGDRFIPVRSQSIARNLFEVPNDVFISPQKIEPFTEEAQNQIKYNSLLENRLLEVKHTDFFSKFVESKTKGVPLVRNKASIYSNVEHKSPYSNESISGSGGFILPKLLKFKTPLRENKESDTIKNLRSPPFLDTENDEKNIFETFKQYRKISKTPYKILDAPSLQDDFYLNLIHWSQRNQLAVSLGQAVWIWNGDTSNVYKFAFKDDIEDIEYTSVQWDPKGNLLGVGDVSGKLEIWDVNGNKKIRKLGGHSDRLDCISWNGNLISTGSRDGSILTRDLRSPNDYIMKYEGHKDEVCGLKWSNNGQQLASGGNDNKVFIWGSRKLEAEAKFKEHSSAVKALAWSPHQQGLLLSGGGCTDKSIKIWNTLSMTLINSIQTDSQVCNMLFSKNSNEFVSTHGLYGNQIIVWKYPEILKMCVLDGPQGHSERVLYLSDSPNGENIVTGASDETLKFWKIFPSKISVETSQLFPSFDDLR